jgi:two-component system chemotaxis sensor kinase CheA
MTEFEEGIDPELQAEFIDEALDGIGEIADLFVTLEEDPSNLDIIQAIFRPIHSIKGNAAFFGLMKTKALSHEMENLLDLMRKNAILPTPSIINVLLKGSDELTRMLQRARQGDPEVTDKTAFKQLLEAIISTAQGERADEESLWQSLLSEISLIGEPELIELAQKLAHLSPAGQKVLGAEKQHEEKGAVPPASGAPAPLQNLLQILADEAPVTDTALKELLKKAREHTSDEETTTKIDAVFGTIDLFSQRIGLDDQMARLALTDEIEKLIAGGTWTDAPPATEQPPADQSGPEQETEKTDPAKTNVQGRTMRVSEDVIDAFLEYVGDLVTIGEMYQHLYTNLQSKLSAHQGALQLRRVNESFSELSHSLQTSIMNIRKVPLNSLLQRAPRIARDVASSSGKKLKTNVSGGDVLVDKSLIDTLEAPLVHMVRNAADHGIEPAETRTAAGKPDTGTINIVAEETASHIVLTIGDDGKGLDFEALAAKARELGITPPGATPTRDDIINLLFRSGVSTAQTVTDVSGRGVGMDVVKRSIEAMGGSITVESQSGLGSTFKVQLPKTVSTQILSGFIVIVYGQRYVLPLDKILRSFRPEPDAISSVQGKGQCVMDGDRLLRICRLCDIFGLPAEARIPLHKGILVVVQSDKGDLALFVDEIEGVRQVVLKNIEGLPHDENLFQGGAVMGDGSIAMILEIDELADFKTDPATPALQDYDPEAEAAVE